MKRVTRAPQTCFPYFLDVRIVAATEDNLCFVFLRSCHRRRLPLFPLSPLPVLLSQGGSEPGFDLLARRRPGMQDRGGPRVRRRMDKSRTVPTDQQPFNELQELREDPLFGWAQEDFKVFEKTFSAY